MLKNRINIMGIPYRVRKCKEQSDVDMYGKDELQGQVNFEFRTISIHVGNKHYKPTDEDIIDTVIHEIFHAISFQLFRRNPEIFNILNDDAVVEPLLASIIDTLNRNKLVEWKIL